MQSLSGSEFYPVLMCDTPFSLSLAPCELALGSKGLLRASLTLTLAHHIWDTLPPPFIFMPREVVVQPLVSAPAFFPMAWIPE